MFRPLSSALQNARDVVAAQPGKAPPLTDYAEILLYSGRFGEAIGALEKAREIEPSERSRELLCDAVLEAVAADFATWRGAGEQWEQLFKSPQRRASWLAAMGEGLAATGDPLAACKMFLKVAQLETPAGDGGGLHPINSALWARRDRWLQGRLIDLRQSCNAAQREAIDALIAERLRNAASADELRGFLSIFAEHPLANDARARLLASLGKDGRLLEKEILLLALRSGGSPAQSRRATAELALLLKDAGRPEEAVVFYRDLAGPLAQTPCLDGKTGRRLVAALEGDAAIRDLLKCEQLWPTGAVTVEPSDSRRASYTRDYGLGIEATRNSLLEDMQLEIVPSGSSHKIQARDGLGEPRWSVTLSLPGQATSRSFNASLLRGRMDGHLLAVWRGNEIYAVDTLSSGGDKAEVLWGKDLVFEFPGIPTRQNLVPRVMQAAGAMPQLVAVDAYGFPAPKLGPVTGRMICFQRMRTLTAADPLTGQTLWVRHDMRLGSDLFGDDDMIFVVPPDAAEAQVLRTADGREIGRRETPPVEDRLETFGRRILTWTTEDEQHVLAMFDPWEQRTLWRRKFSGNSRLWRPSPGEISVVDPQGRFLTLALPEGKPLIDAKIDPEPKLSEAFVLRSPSRFVLFANRPIESGPNITPVPGGYQNPIINAKVYGFDRFTGEQVWQTEVSGQSLDLSQPMRLPILTFANRVYEREPNGRILRYYSQVLCLDKRSGDRLLDETITSSISRVQVVPDAKQRTIDVRTTRKSFLLKFGDKAAEKPVHEPAAKKEGEPAPKP